MLNLEKNTSFKVLNFPARSINKKFDIIICSEVLEHLPNDKLAIDKMKKMLKKKGLLLITVPSRNAPLYKWGLANNFDRQVGHLRRYSMEELSLMLKNAGLKIIYRKKSEGLLRNLLYLSRRAGKVIRFLKFYLSDIVTLLDNSLIPIFGESNLIIVSRK